MQAHPDHPALEDNRIVTSALKLDQEALVWLEFMKYIYLFIFRNICKYTNVYNAIFFFCDIFILSLTLHLSLFIHSKLLFVHLRLTKNHSYFVLENLLFFLKEVVTFQAGSFFNFPASRSV